METREEILHNNIMMLGEMLDEVVLEAEGKHIFSLICKVRELSKEADTGNLESQNELLTILQNLKDEEFLPIARAFNQILNLTNTAEQNVLTSLTVSGQENPVNFSGIYSKLKNHNIADEKIKDILSQLSIDLVLTAHPTEINRRSLINNLNQVDRSLTYITSNIAEYKKNQVKKHLKQLIAQYWYTDEIRQRRPTPNEEAKWGYEVIENTLWYAVPQFIKELEEQLEESIGFTFPLDAKPIKFSSWMGGDRDGNPNVTAKTTCEVLLDSRKRAAKMFLKDIEILVKELSMKECTEEFRKFINDYTIQEPYRKLMMGLRTRLRDTIYYLEHKEIGSPLHMGDTQNLILDESQLWEPLLAAYQSLIASGMKIIARDNLLNTLRRLKCFGLTLTQLDIRQESTVHTEALGELTRYLEIGDYEKWDEKTKVDFLIKELTSKRPLIPLNWDPSPQTKELLDTCKVIASTPEGIIPTYVISMTKEPSDILAVYLLLKEINCPYHLPVTPLFETLTDLNNSERIMKLLFDIPWYKKTINGKQMVMIGYSDSAKDAGVMAAGWAQYKAQEALLNLSHNENIKLKLFHGRGGTIGRGGAPARDAIFSQPPGSLSEGLRVTEQGEMIRFKFATPDLAISTLSLYTDAILEANILPPAAPKKEWREIMEKLSEYSREKYQGTVKDNPDFIVYFYEATPEAELSKLPLGSRPAKRRKDGGLESLRAIPWIFGWTQNRLMLPSWLGAGYAYRRFIEKEGSDILLEMNREWSFFASRLSMLEMVYTKTDINIAEYYDKRLVKNNLQYIGQELRETLKKDMAAVLSIVGIETMGENIPNLQTNVRRRNIYIDPLNVLQVELLHRSRSCKKESSKLEEALMVTISGIAAGVRNSG